MLSSTPLPSIPKATWDDNVLPVDYTAIVNECLDKYFELYDTNNMSAVSDQSKKLSTQQKLKPESKHPVVNIAKFLLAQQKIALYIVCVANRDDFFTHTGLLQLLKIGDVKTLLSIVHITIIDSLVSEQVKSTGSITRDEIFLAPQLNPPGLPENLSLVKRLWLSNVYRSVLIEQIKCMVYYELSSAPGYSRENRSEYRQIFIDRVIADVLKDIFDPIRHFYHV